MNNAVKIGGMFAIVIALVASGFAIGAIWNSQRNLVVTDIGGFGHMLRSYGSFGGMMGNSVPGPQFVPKGGERLSLEGAVEVAEAYIANYGIDTLAIAEVMQFDNHFYAEVIESDTGIHAMEILIDPFTATVHPEPGPNMMWNTKYGMMGGFNSMMGGRGRMDGYPWDFRDFSKNEMAVSPEQARELAQEELDRLSSGITVDEEVDMFYGYYTIHTLREGAVIGMLSVHGYTGQVWIHTWHGDFIDMTEHDHS